MNLQYISGSKSKSIGVFIPIQEWENLKIKCKGLGNEDTVIPDWYKDW